MKKNYLLILAAIFTLGACNYLDKEPDDMKTDEMVWTNKNEVYKYLTNCYAGLPLDNLHQGDPWLGCSDECDIVWYVYPSYSINLGSWEPSTAFYVKWNTYYKAIRATFVFENNIGRCTELSDDLKSRYVGEVKFLRGYYYFLLLRQYGPAVLIKEQLSNSTDFGSLPRAPFDECIDYVCLMMDEAEDLLPATWVSEPSNYGRANKLTCRAVKAQARLLAASEQWNGNPMYADFKNQNGTLLASQVYDPQKWQLAADAAKAVIDLADAQGGTVGLYTAGQDVTSPTYNPYKPYYELFNNGWNKEIVWGTIDSGRPDWTYNDQPRYAWMIHCNPVNNRASAGMGGVGPTLRLVDAFYMENGYGIEDSGSGYVESGFATSDSDHITVPESQQSTETGRVKLIDQLKSLDAWGHMKGDYNMFVGREARFYASINYQHRINLTTSNDKAGRNLWSSTKNADGYGRLECYFGGTANSASNLYSYSSTGFYPQKRMVPCTWDIDNNLSGNYISIYIRYAEILLDYIEALNEVNPGSADIRTYWDQIHARAGIPSIFTTHPEIAGDKVKQREYIIRERQIELNLEGDRYYTTRRRLLSGTKDAGGETDPRKYGDGGRVWGLTTFGDFKGDPVTNGFESPEFYVRRAIETRVWKDAYYLFPIPQTEIDKSPALVQNPGWSSSD